MKLEESSSEVRTNTDFVLHVERTLGFVLPTGKPAWKARMIEAGKLKRKREQNPRLFSMDNLLLTVDWLRQQKREVKSPAAVCWFVEDALKNARSERPATTLDMELEAAIAAAVRDDQWDWVSRLTRAQGDEGRRAVLAEWKAAQ